MRVLFLAGIITAATVPFAAASENVIDCQVDDTRRAAAEQRVEAPTSPAPVVTAGRPTVVQREAAEAPRPAPPARRRSGKPVPDADLIAPRGVL